MIGKAYWAVFKYYDSAKRRMAFKKRPVLIIGEADQNDYVVLPISRVTQKGHIDLHYDFEMHKEDYPALSLKATSYVRTHKQTVVNNGELVDSIANFKEEYSEAYISILALVEEFQKNLISRAL